MFVVGYFPPNTPRRIAVNMAKLPSVQILKDIPRPPNSSEQRGRWLVVNAKGPGQCPRVPRTRSRALGPFPGANAGVLLPTRSNAAMGKKKDKSKIDKKMKKLKKAMKKGSKTDVKVDRSDNDNPPIGQGST
jgi:hypothetical protein